MNFTNAETLETPGAPISVSSNCTPNFDVSTLGWFSSKSTLGYIQLALNSIGVFGNLALLLVLIRSPLGSKMATIFFMHQAYLDCCVNFMSSLLAIQPPKWRTNWSAVIDTLICRLWHSQVLFWLFVQLSVVNLVLIGLERFWAIVHPVYYSKIKPRRQSCICLIVSAIYNCIYVLPICIEGRYVLDCSGAPHCLGRSHDPFTNLIMAGYSVCWGVSFYLVALTLMCIFYGSVIYQLNRTKLALSQSTSSDRKKVKATRQFTKAVIIITIVYVLCMTYDAMAYILSRFGITKYEHGTWMHQLGMFAVSLNSFANPLIYFWIVMRKSFLAKMCPGRYGRGTSSQHSIATSELK